MRHFGFRRLRTKRFWFRGYCPRRGAQASYGVSLEGSTRDTELLRERQAPLEVATLTTDLRTANLREFGPCTGIKSGTTRDRIGMGRDAIGCQTVPRSASSCRLTILGVCGTRRLRAVWCGTTGHGEESYRIMVRRLYSGNRIMRFPCIYGPFVDFAPTTIAPGTKSGRIKVCRPATDEYSA